MEHAHEPSKQRHHAICGVHDDAEFFERLSMARVQGDVIADETQSVSAFITTPKISTFAHDGVGAHEFEGEVFPLCPPVSLDVLVENHQRVLKIWFEQDRQGRTREERMATPIMDWTGTYLPSYIPFAEDCAIDDHSVRRDCVRRSLRIVAARPDRRATRGHDDPAGSDWTAPDVRSASLTRVDSGFSELDQEALGRPAPLADDTRRGAPVVGVSRVVEEVCRLHEPKSDTLALRAHHGLIGRYDARSPRPPPRALLGLAN